MIAGLETTETKRLSYMVPADVASDFDDLVDQIKKTTKTTPAKVFAWILVRGIRQANAELRAEAKKSEGTNGAKKPKSSAMPPLDPPAPGAGMSS